MVEMTGGCQCGAVRYRAEVKPETAILCHCGMCKKATGGISIAYINTNRADVHWDGEPNWYASSAIAERPFCGTCGTPLGFRYFDSDKIDLTVGSFDEPGHFMPTSHFAAEAIVESWIDTSSLPRMRSDEYQPLVERWASIGEKPA